MSKIDKSLEEYKNWCSSLGILCADDINRASAQGEINNIINLSEIWHEHCISNIAETIKENIGSKKIIMIAGPSSSGKTSFSHRLMLHLKVLGINAKTISLDDYYYDKSDTPLEELDYLTFDYADSLDYNLFGENMKTLLSGAEASLPIFDFATRRQIIGKKNMRLNDNEVIIVEGLHALNDVVTSRVGGGNLYKIYCTALTCLKRNDGSKISPRSARLLRRLIRDCYFRSSNANFTFQMWDDVEKAAEVNIYPFTDSADVVFNSSVLYEFCVYKKHAAKFMSDGQVSEKYKNFTDSINSLLSDFSPLDDSFVPRMCFVREFIGGSSLF